MKYFVVGKVYTDESGVKYGLSTWEIPYFFGYKTEFLYAHLKNGRIMLYPSASVRPSVCKLFRFRVTPPTVCVRLS